MCDIKKIPTFPVLEDAKRKYEDPRKTSTALSLLFLKHWPSRAKEKVKISIYWKPKYRTKKTISYLRNHIFKTMTHWFHFHLVRDVFAFASTNCPSVFVTFSIGMKVGLLFFEDADNNAGKSVHLQIRLRIPFKLVSWLLKDMKPTKIVTATIKALYHPFHPTDVFTNKILSCHVISRIQDLFLDGNPGCTCLLLCEGAVNCTVHYLISFKAYKRTKLPLLSLWALLVLLLVCRPQDSSCWSWRRYKLLYQS